MKNAILYLRHTGSRFAIFFLIAAACLQAACSLRPGAASSSSNAADSTAYLDTTVLSMAFVGDVMMGTNFPSNYLTPDSGRTLFSDCRDILSSADIAIANLEGTCYDGTDGELREMTNPNTYFIFRMPGYLASRLVDAGIDAVNCANNHSFDFGMTGRRHTLETLRKAGIQASGVRELAEGCILERRGVKVGYVSFAASCTQVLDMNDEAEIDSMLALYRPKCDVLVVGFHGGAEGTGAMHVPGQVEYYVGENRADVKAFAHHCIDRGADLVIGHGPHVPRALELYNGHIIAYSLGNFCAPYRLGSAGAIGHAPLLTVRVKASDGSFVSGQIHSFRQVHGAGPRLDESRAAANDIRRLTQEDFPSTPLSITAEGLISLSK